MKIPKHHFKILYIVLSIFVLLLILATFNFGDDKKIIWGVTFSKKQCQDLDLDWRLVYTKILNEMPIQTIRLPLYWDDIETSPNNYNFEDYIWMTNQAAERNIEILPVLGRRVPRWPECHTPTFYKNFPEDEIQTKILALIHQEVLFFQNYPNINKWQIDNEPFLNVFGKCPPSDKDFLNSEIDLVRSLDNRPILITESGELSTWINGAKHADIVGTSMYRQTWNRAWGYFTYPLGPWYYYFKAQIVKLFTGVDDIINTELQVEPWAFSNNLKLMDLSDQFYTMDLNQIKNNVKFAKRSGINEIYLWGLEWWWWLGQEHGIWEFWEYGKTLNNTK